MRVGMVGLGKLGLPVAYAMASRGLEVYGYDPHVSAPPEDVSHEHGLAETILAAEGRMRFCSDVAEVVAACEVVFVAVQTPHEREYEGITPLPDERKDFDYRYLEIAAAEIAAAAWHQQKRLTVAVISTVLPGTMRKRILPRLQEGVSLVYNPSFIAMGTTISDFLQPEFVLLGGDEQGLVEAVYREVFGAVDRPRHARMSIESAELTKVAYNTFIGLKLAFANTLLEVCEKTEGTDVDEVTGALKLAHRRLISPAYLDAGMGDGGSCHPRDNIALSWLARELELSFDIFEAAMLQRERQGEWLADRMEALGAEHNLPLGILGFAYKPRSHLIAGSHPLFVASVLRRRGHPVDLHDPYAQQDAGPPMRAQVFLVGCKHPEYAAMPLPEGSVVIDPWRYLSPQEGVRLVRLGARAPGTPKGQVAAARPDKAQTAGRS